MQCGAFDLVTFDKLYSPTGTVTIGSISAKYGRVSNKTLVSLPYVGSTAAITGAQLVNTYIVIGDLTSGIQTYTIPAAADISAAFTTAGHPLATGDTFDVYIFRGKVQSSDTNALTIGLAAGATACTFATGVTTLTMTFNKVIKLKFEVTSSVTPAIRIHPIMG